MTKLQTGKSGFNIEDINIVVTCPECERIINITTKKPSIIKNCRCNKGTWRINIKPSNHSVTVHIEFEDGKFNRKIVEANKITVGEE